MKHIVVVTGLVLSTPLFVACAENTKPSASASAQKAADQAEQTSQQAQKQAAEARQNELAAQQKAAVAQQNLRHAQAQEVEANQRAQQASFGAGHAEQQAGAAVPRAGVTEAQGQGTGAAGQPRKVIVVTVGLLFPRNGADLAPAAKPKLDEVAAALNQRPEANEVIVEGFTDDTGDASFNKTLSKGRAQAVADYLVSRGVPMDRITTKGLGQENPVSTEKTVEARAMNRRVEIVIQPVTGQAGGQPGGH